MRKTLTFDELWKLAKRTASVCNGLTYYHSCDIWTSRSAKVSRDSHKQKLQWKNLLSTLDKSCEDKEQALLAKMIEEGWQLPAILNEPCQSASRQVPQIVAAFRLYNHTEPPEDLQASLLHQDIVPLSLNMAFQEAPGTPHL
jgi:hypothetical protein